MSRSSKGAHKGAAGRARSAGGASARPGGRSGSRGQPLTTAGRLVTAGVLGALAALPLAINPFGFNPFGPVKALAVACCALCVAAGFALSPAELERTLRDLWHQPAAKAFLALGALMALATATSVDASQSLVGSYPEYQGMLLVLAAGVIAVGAAWAAREGELGVLLRVVTVSMLLVLAYAAAQRLGLDPMEFRASYSLERLRSTLGNASNLGVYLVLTLPVAFALARSDRSPAWRVSGWMALAGGLAVLAMTYSRGAWVGFGVAGLVWLALESRGWPVKRRMLVWGGAVLAVVLVGGVLYAASPDIAKRIRTATDFSRGTTEWRLVVWSTAAEMAGDRPLLGWGPNSFRFKYPGYRDAEAQQKSGTTVGDAHNIVMQAAATSGWPAALALVAGIGLLIAAGVRTSRSEGSGHLAATALTAAIAGGVSAVLFHFATLDTLPIFGALGGLLLGRAAAEGPDAAVQAKPTTPSPALRWGAAALAGALALAAVAALGLVFADDYVRGGFARAAAGAKWEETAQPIRTATALAPWEPAVEWAGGRAALDVVAKTGDMDAHDEGTAILKRVRERLPLDSAMLWDEGNLHLAAAEKTANAKLAEAALDVLDQAVAEDPANGRYHVSRALALASLGRLEEAAATLERAMRIVPDLDQGWIALSRVYEALGDKQKAAEARARAE